jgi:hypothetical protein
MTLVVENAPLHLRARYAAIPQIGSPIGTILSSGGFFVMTPAVLAGQLRLLRLEDPVPRRHPAAPRRRLHAQPARGVPGLPSARGVRRGREEPLRTTFTDSWKQIIMGMAAALLGVGGFYLVTAFCVWYGVNILGYDDSLLLLGSMVAAAVEIFALLWGGMPWAEVRGQRRSSSGAESPRRWSPFPRSSCSSPANRSSSSSP